MKKEKLPKLIVILGPTASGKTELAIKLAKKFNGEIVSADSRQVYREMDIGTAKPLKQQEAKDKKQEYIVKGVPHYMIDIVNPDEEFNVAIYKKIAIKAIKNIQKREKLPFLVGGTGLYIQAIVDNIDFPRVPPQKKLRKKLEKKTKKELFKIYRELDPEGAKLIDKENKRRLIRAIEVCKATKKSFWQQRKKGKPLFDVLQIGIKLPKTELKKRVEKRIDKMFKLGLEREVKKLIKKYGWNIPSMQAIDYQEWKNYFKGKIKLEEIKKEIKIHTLQFSKRQMTWFKRNKRIHWIKNYQKAKKLIKKVF
ncbi:tRNA (adenosine(37)-N6)-dimethylallyltransferase MiaA [Patescibacteria group bacterium]|nr:tRNA (adenosine(37)-N6)-dimethylallyltransferase MiaA [Patescibacteria group bacterium]